MIAACLLTFLPQSENKKKAPEVNLYGYILESEYAMTVAGYYLAVCHPENDGPQLIRCPRMDLEMNAIHAYEMQCGRAGRSKPGEDAPFLL